MRSVYCRDCPRYDDAAERCRDGKVNPRTYEQCLETSRVLGLRAICVFNDHRERLIGARQSLGRR